MLECLQNDMRPEFNRSRHIHQDIDLSGSCQEQGIFRYHGPARPDGILHLPLRFRLDDVPQPRIAIDMDRLFQVAILHGDHAHARYAVYDLIREPLSHETGPEHCDTDRVPLFLSGL